MMFIIRAGLQILADHPRLYLNAGSKPDSEWMRLRESVPARPSGQRRRRHDLDRKGRFGCVAETVGVTRLSALRRPCSLVALQFRPPVVDQRSALHRLVVLYRPVEAFGAHLVGRVPQCVIDCAAVLVAPVAGKCRVQHLQRSAVDCVLRHDLHCRATGFRHGSAAGAVHRRSIRHRCRVVEPPSRTHHPLRCAGVDVGLHRHAHGDDLHHRLRGQRQPHHPWHQYEFVVGGGAVRGMDGHCRRVLAGRLSADHQAPAADPEGRASVGRAVQSPTGTDQSDGDLFGRRHLAILLDQR